MAKPHWFARGDPRDVDLLRARGLRRGTLLSGTGRGGAGGKHFSRQGRPLDVGPKKRCWKPSPAETGRAMTGDEKADVLRRSHGTRRAPTTARTSEHHYYRRAGRASQSSRRISTWRRARSRTEVRDRARRTDAALATVAGGASVGQVEGGRPHRYAGRISLDEHRGRYVWALRTATGDSAPSTINRSRVALGDDGRQRHLQTQEAPASATKENALARICDRWYRHCRRTARRAPRHVLTPAAASPRSASGENDGRAGRARVRAGRQDDSRRAALGAAVARAGSSPARRFAEAARFMDGNVNDEGGAFERKSMRRPMCAPGQDALLDRAFESAPSQQSKRPQAGAPEERAAQRQRFER